MKRVLVTYFATLATFCVADFVWLGVVMPDFYESQIGPLLLATPRLDAAAAFYVLYPAGILGFGIWPALAVRSSVRAAVGSALLGLLAYATYDLSNLATLKGWSATVALVDIAWGTFVSGLSGSVGYFVAKGLGQPARFAVRRQTL